MVQIGYLRLFFFNFEFLFSLRTNSGRKLEKRKLAKMRKAFIMRKFTSGFDGILFLLL